MRRSWLARPDPAVAAANDRAAALGPAVHAELLAAGDRLAETSALLALRAYEHAAPAWSRFGEAGFRRWWTLGHELATGEPACREGALAYFGVAPADFGRGGVDTAAAWCALGREVARVSRRLATAFLERTPSVLRRADAIPRLRAWVDAGLPLYETRGWRGAFLAQAYFDAAAEAVVALGPADYRAWAEAGAALSDAAEERQFFAVLPPGLARWDDADRARFLATTVALAAGAPRPARAFYRELPPAVGDLPGPQRSALLRTLAALDPRVAASLAELVPVVGAVLREVPDPERLDALGHVEALAARHPEAAVAALRILPRLYEDAPPAEVRHWFSAGTAIAAENPAAGRAYFALESRTSVRVLRAASTAATLEETEGVWRKLIQMLSGEGASVRGVATFSLRPPLEDVPAECEVALPLEVDGLPTHEENCRLYRFLAAQLAGRREFGTYVRDDLRARLRDPAESELLEDLFLLAEGVRISHRLSAGYAGLAGEAEWAGTRLLERWGQDPAPSRAVLLDTLLALVLGARNRPEWLPADALRLVADLLRPLASPEATVEDSMRVARALAGVLVTPALLLRAAASETELLLDDLTGGDPLYPFDGGPAEGEAAAPADPMRVDPFLLELAPEADDRATGGQPLTAEELRRLIK